MNICIYHNLKTGGAYLYFSKIVNNLLKKNRIDIYSFQKNNHHVSKFFRFRLNHTKNIFEHVYQIISELRIKSKNISKIINTKNYDLVIVFNDYLIQTPYILRYLSHKYQNKIIYITQESKREFYEKTNFNHYNIKKIISRIIRFPIKLIDKRNMQYAQNIISNSYYSQHILKKIYKKNSIVIYPGLKKSKLVLKTQKNNHVYVSFSDYSYTKGHHISINQIKSIKNAKLLIAGRKNNDFTTIKQLIKQKNIKYYVNINTKTKKNLLNNKYIFLANQINEPFGLTNLEIVSKDNYIIGLNNSGNSEIIDHGINGLLYPNKKEIDTIIDIDKKDVFHFFKNKYIDWNNSSLKLLNFYHFLKNEPQD